MHLPPPLKRDAIAQTYVKRPVARGKLQAAIIHAYNTAPLSRQSTKNAIETMHVFNQSAIYKLDQEGEVST